MVMGYFRHVNKQPVSVRMCSYKLLTTGPCSTELHKHRVMSFNFSQVDNVQVVTLQYLSLYLPRAEQR